MNKINSFDEISPLVRKYMKKGFATNDFLNSIEYEKLIEEDRLYYIDFGTGVFFLKKRENDYLCYYEIADFDYVPLLEGALERVLVPVVVEIVTRPGDESFTNVASFFETIGFKTCVERLRMERKKESDKLKWINTSEDVQLKFATVSDHDEIKRFLVEHFNLHTGCIPNLQELEEQILNNEYIIALNNERKIIGVLHYQIRGNKAEIRHLAVKSDYRKKNIASYLVQKYHGIIEDKKATLWVSKENDIAKKFYAKNGYEFDDYFSKVLIWRYVKINICGKDEKYG